MPYECISFSYAQQSFVYIFQVVCMYDLFYIKSDVCSNMSNVGYIEKIVVLKYTVPDFVLHAKSHFCSC